MAYNHYDGGIIADHATGRPFAATLVSVFDDETDAPVETYIEGRPASIMSGAHGLIPQFQTEDSTRRVRMEVGPVRLRQWSQEMVDAGGDAVAELERLTISHIERTPDGRLAFAPGTGTVPVARTSSGRLAVTV